MIAAVRLLLAHVRWRLRRLRDQARPVVAETSVAAGRALTRVGTGLLLYPHRGERIDVPTTVEIDGTHVDIVDDLVEYTGLARGQVVALIQRRHESFRAEWYALPPALQNEGWFYLSSRTYLFANAVHDAGDLAAALARLLPHGSAILDFGGGTGNLALALAARGHRVDFVERSALQKDFVRFRIEKHRFDGRLRVRDQWSSLESSAYDLVCAFDVFEHVADLIDTLENVLQAVRPGGMLAECSPFVRSISNPMHHEDESAFVGVVRAAGFVPIRQDERFRLWKAGEEAT